MYSPMIFFQQYRNFRRYIRSKLRFAKEEADNGEKRSHMAQPAISELLKCFRSTKGPLWVFRYVVSFHHKLLIIF